MSDNVKLWAADPHRFGPGKVHAIDHDRPLQTYCGKVMSAFPGKPVSSGSVTCKVCGDAPARRANDAARRQEWEHQQQERERQQSEQDAAWWNRYNTYLQSAAWRELRARVLLRAQNRCEGCGVRVAVQVHHLTYAHVCAELLWELRAVCMECHERLHDEVSR